LTSDKKSDQKILRRNYIGKNLDDEFPLVLTSNKKCDKKKLRHNYTAKNLDDIANKLPDLTNIKKNLSKLTVLKNALKFIEKSDQDMQRILNENEILRKEKNLYLNYIIQ
ncbi:7791_t:CDS:2, partial [Gigaspora margarita]